MSVDLEDLGRSSSDDRRRLVDQVLGVFELEIKAKDSKETFQQETMREGAYVALVHCAEACRRDCNLLFVLLFRKNKALFVVLKVELRFESLDFRPYRFFVTQSANFALDL